MPDPRTAVLIPAAGSGTRLGGGTPKALRVLRGRTILERAVSSVSAHPSVRQIVIAAPSEMVADVRSLLCLHDTSAERAAAPPLGGPRVDVVAGGATRQESVSLALAAVDPRCDIVLVHDAARPLVPLGVVERVVAAVSAGSPAVIPVLPVVDTIRQVAGDRSTATPDRSSLRAVQTPQGFDRQTLHDAYRHAESSPEAGATDDAAVAEAAGIPVTVVPGHPEAFKITLPEDMSRAQTLLDQRRGHSDPGRTPLIATSVDVHAFDAERPLHLAGLHWPGEPGLGGHSDADVACHAAAEALLAAAGLGDLGSNFGTDEPQWAGASGTTLLSEAASRVRSAGYTIGNVSVQIIGNRPRLGPRRMEAEEAMGAAAGAAVRLCATTTDGLGLTGRGEGVAAVATALLTPSIPG